jgi:putative transposase
LWLLISASKVCSLLGWLLTDAYFGEITHLAKSIDDLRLMLGFGLTIHQPDLTVTRQCELLGLPRSSLYYQPVPVRESTLRIMARIDAFYLEDLTAGSRRMVQYLARDGIPISRDRVRNLMRRMGLRAIYQNPRTTVPGEPSERFPCLADVRAVTTPDQVWATDITYIPLQKGFLYLVAIVDLFSRHVLSWKLS